MSKCSSVQKRKFFKYVYWPISVIYWIIMFTIAYHYPEIDGIVLWGSAVSLLLWVGYTLTYVFKNLSWVIQDLMIAYRKNNDLLSGGFAIIFFFLVITLTSGVISQMDLPEMYKAMSNTFSAFSMSAMTALVGLLGIRYSIAIQERNRKADLRLSAKPYLEISCYVKEIIPNEDKHTFNKVILHIDITNISKNIVIPVGIKSSNTTETRPFKYKPIKEDATLQTDIEIDNKKPIEAKLFLDLYYKDVYANVYKTAFSIHPHDSEDITNLEMIEDVLFETSSL